MQELGTVDHCPLVDGSRSHITSVGSGSGSGSGGSVGAVEAQVHQCCEADIGLSPLAEAHDLVQGLSICETTTTTTTTLIITTATAATAAIISTTLDNPVLVLLLLSIKVVVVVVRSM